MSETGGLHTLSSTGGSTSGTLIQMPPDNAAAFYIPHRIPYNTSKERFQLLLFFFLLLNNIFVYIEKVMIRYI